MPAEIFGQIEKVAMEYHKVPGHEPKELLEIFEKNNFIVQEKLGNFIFAVNKNYLLKKTW